MFIILVTGLLVVSLDYYQSPHCLVILFFPLAFFISQLFISIRRRWVAEVLFVVFLVITLANGYFSYFGIFKINQRMDAGKILPVPDPYDSMVTNQKVLQVGDHSEIYRHARLASPFLSWAISKKYLEHPDNPEVLITITRQMIHDLPDIIIDDNGIIKRIFSLTPVLAEKYKQVDDQGIYYRLK